MGIPLAALTVKPPEHPDLLGTVGKALSLKAAMTQQQIANTQLEEHQRAIAEEKAVRDAIANAGGLEAALPEIMKVAPTRGVELSKSLQEWKNADLSTKKTKLELEMKRAEGLGQIAGGITDEATFKAGLDKAVKSELIDPNAAARLAIGGYKPEVVKGWQDGALSTAERLKEQHAQVAEKLAAEEQAAKIAHDKEMEKPEIIRQRADDYKTYLAANPDKPKNAKTEYAFNTQWDKNHAALLRASRAAALAPEVAPTDALAVNPESQSILAQTGLSMQGFMALTGNMSSLSRDAATRQAALAEANRFANAKGVDVSTLASQYKAANETVQKNIQRANNTKIMEDEIQGTIDNLKTVANDSDLGKLRFGNVVKVWAGQEVNDDLAQQYALHLGQLRNELAGYYAAAQGKNEITVADQREAEQTIKNGISQGGLEGLRKGVESSTGKMAGVMQRSVDSSRRQVWNLFGVGDKFKPSAGAKPAGGSFDVKAPNGTTYKFGTQAEADRFKAAAGIK